MGGRRRPALCGEYRGINAGRIATGGLRTGNDIAFYGGAVCGGTHGCRPTRRFVGQGPRALPGSAGKLGSGRCRHRTLRKRISGGVGEGLSCPPSCQPTDGHCRARQSGHFLETGSLHPPLAALRRFPLPRTTARVAPTEGLPIGFRRGRCSHRPASVTRDAEERAG